MKWIQVDLDPTLIFFIVNKQIIQLIMFHEVLLNLNKKTILVLGFICPHPSLLVVGP